VVRIPSLLIIEEPEAHLHPETQVKIVRLIAKLVRNGLYILITTHSDFLLNEISNLILAGNLKPEERAKEGYGPDEYLTKDEVIAYLFKMGDKGSTALKLEITNEGIPGEEFEKIASELYDKFVRMHYRQTRRGVTDGEEARKEEV